MKCTLCCDGVSASWHVSCHAHRAHARGKPIKDQELRVLVANDIGPGYYGRIGEDCCFVPGPATCVIGIDPGHANIIVAAKRSVNNAMRSKFTLKNTHEVHFMYVATHERESSIFSEDYITHEMHLHEMHLHVHALRACVYAFIRSQTTCKEEVEHMII